MGQDRIEKGDIVDIHFTTSQSLFGVEVLSIPCATGDSWKVKDEQENIYLVQLFERMDKKMKGSTDFPF